MSFTRYPTYTDSGVDWLGEVPGHWSLKPIWTYFRRVKRTGFEGEQLLSVYRDHGVVPKASREDNFNKPSDDLSTYQLVVPGDLVINKMKAWQGSVAISQNRGIVSPAYFVYAAVHDSDSRYLNYLMRSLRYITGYLTVSKGIRVNQWDLEPELHSRLPLLVPPAQEQECIADFLGRETAKIDALVAGQRRLMELLKEKRQAVISHAVTKGVNPDAPKKGSGIEWLGDVPAHWAVRSVRRVSAFLTSGPRGWSEKLGEEGRLFIQSGDLDDSLQIDFSAAKRVQVGEDAEADRTRLLEGDVVVCITGAKTGNVAVCAGLPELAHINQHLCLIRLNESILPAFLGAFLKSSAGQTYFDLSQYGLKQGLSLQDVRDSTILVPPLDEQASIVEFIAKETKKFDALSAAADRAVNVLQERRSALISAAVTGQIDVRGFVDQEAA